MSDPTEVVFEVITALAEAENVTPSELEYTLADYVDPDVLVNLSEHETSTWTLTFGIEDHTVELNHTGEIFIDGVLYSDSTSPHA